jgi:hypothetical protein
MQRCSRLALFAASAALVTGCQTLQTVPEPTADLSTILNQLRDEIAQAQATSSDRPANLSIKSATVILKVTAGSTGQHGGEITKAPVKLSFTRTTTGTLENTITLELAGACTQDITTDSAKDSKSTKLSCVGNLNSSKEFEPGPTVLSTRPRLPTN